MENRRQTAGKKVNVVDNKSLQELKQLYLDAEERQRDAYRRAVWLEKHLYDACDDSEFEATLSTLKECEKELQRVSAEAMIARAQYAAAGSRAQ